MVLLWNFAQHWAPFSAGRRYMAVRLRNRTMLYAAMAILNSPSTFLKPRTITFRIGPMDLPQPKASSMRNYESL